MPRGGSKGAKKPKLRDLSVYPLTREEEDALMRALMAATSPIAVAILGAVLVEHELETSLRRRFQLSDSEWEEMVDERGPLSTFSRKIDMGHALRLYDATFVENMHIVRNVRNAFAHSKRVVDFHHELVVKELNRIKVPRRGSRNYKKLPKDNPRQRYSNLCFLLVIELLKRKTRLTMRQTKRKMRKPTPYLKALGPVLGFGSLGGNPFTPSHPTGFGLSGLGVLHQGSNPQSSQDRQSGDPNREAPRGLLSGLFETTEEPPRKKGSDK